MVRKRQVAKKSVINFKRYIESGSTPTKRSNREMITSSCANDEQNDQEMIEQKSNEQEMINEMTLLLNNQNFNSDYRT